MSSFSIMQFPQQLVDTIFKFLASILYLGNINYTEEKFSDNNPCTITNLEVLKQAATLLEIPPDKLAHALLFKTIVLPGG